MEKFSKALGAIAVSFLLPAMAQAVPFSSGSTGADGAFNPTSSQTIDLPANGTFNYTSVNIPAGVTITYKKNAANTPVVILVSGDATVAGTIDVSGENATNMGVSGIPGKGGPGGFDGGWGGMPGVNRKGGVGAGPGGGSGGSPCTSYNPAVSAGGGGASYAAAGNNGSSWCSAATAGSMYGSALLVPMLGGSGGGGGTGAADGSSFYGTGGGGGGGAILIVASGKMTISGIIRANGGAGGNNTNNISGATYASSSMGAGGGGGSGGAIRLVASVLAQTGTLQAVGGAGGTNITGATGIFSGGSGGAGIARSEIITSGTFTLQGSPTLKFTKVGSVAAPANPTGDGDIELALDTPNPVTVELAATNIPVNTVVKVVVTPKLGGASTSFNSAPLAGTVLNSTSTASVNVPLGASSMMAQTTFTMTLAQGEALRQFAEGEPVQKVRLETVLNGEASATLITATGKEFMVPTTVLALAGVAND